MSMAFQVTYFIRTRVMEHVSTSIYVNYVSSLRTKRHFLLDILIERMRENISFTILSISVAYYLLLLSILQSYAKKFVEN